MNTNSIHPVPHTLFTLILAWLISPLAHAAEIVVVAGEHPAQIHPVQITVSQQQFWEPLADGDWKLVSEQETIPLQVIRKEVIDGMAVSLQSSQSGLQPVTHHVWELFFQATDLTPYEKRVYQIERADEQERITLTRDEHKVSVTVSGTPFTEYRYAVTDQQPRPILFPVHGPAGVAMTRGYPMVEAKETERKDHPHHQSFWVSHGDVNGVNFWHLGEEQGYQRHETFAALKSGPVVGRIDAVLNWEDETGNHVLKERRVMTFWELGDDHMRIVDVDSTFLADTADVVFGDTKEGGLLSLRVAGTMKESSKPGGIITNANGETTERSAWGKASPWCDYSGPVDGTIAGITIMDHPENPFYPSRYHVRNYGLFTANPFGLSHFLRDNSIDGSRTLRQGQTWRCRYRVYIHTGDVKSGKVAEQYNAFAHPPRVYFQ